MSLFRDPDKAAPGMNPDLPWPLDGIIYVIMLWCIPGAAFGFGMTVGGLRGFGVGLLIGVAMGGGNALLFDWVVDRFLVEFQAAAQRPLVRILFNIAGFTWAIGLTILSTVATLGALHWLGIAGP